MRYLPAANVNPLREVELILSPRLLAYQGVPSSEARGRLDIANIGDWRRAPGPMKPTL